MVAKFNLESMTKGWFIGPFTPSLLKTNSFECAVKRYLAGDHENAHIHKVATEYTVVVEGRVRMNGVLYERNDIIVIEPGESTDFEAITDVVTMVVKIPAVLGDKYDC